MKRRPRDLKMPNNKLQNPNKSQHQNSKYQTKVYDFEFEIYLGFGA
jgi:hypothetical protein